MNTENTVPIITVDALKLSCSLKTTFEGIAMVFNSIGAEIELPELPEQEATPPKPAVKKPNTIREPVPKPPVPEPEQPQVEAVAPSSLTLDDITKVIVGKIKQNRSNNEKIEKLVQGFGVATVKQIPAEKYEDFMTKLASI